MSSSNSIFSRAYSANQSHHDNIWWRSPHSTRIEISNIYSTPAEPGGWNSMILLSNRFAKIIEHSSTNDYITEKAIADGHFKNLSNAVDDLLELDEDDSNAITTEAANSAKYALVLFRAHNVPAPRLFPHDNELVVFKWEDHGSRKYAYIEDGMITFKLYGPGDREPVTLDFQLDKFVQIGTAIGLLGGVDEPTSSAR